jgi:adenylate cyclase
MARQTFVTGFEGDPAAMKRSSACVAARWKSILIMLKLDVYRHGGNALASTLGTGRGGDGGLAAAERALSLNPDLAEAHAVKARILSEENRNDEASREIEIALQLDPESHQVNRSAAVLRFRQQQLEEAIRHWEKAVGAGGRGLRVVWYVDYLLYRTRES